MIFSYYAQESWNMTSWSLGDINFQISNFPLNSVPVPYRATAPSQISNCKLTTLAQ